MSIGTEAAAEHHLGLVLFDQGYNSKCFTDGKKVIKVVPGGKTRDVAHRKLDQLAGEYNVIKTHLGKYAIDSLFSLEQTDGWIVKIEQEFVSGTPLRKSLDKPNPAVDDFLGRSLEMYRETGITPDLYPDIMFDPTLGIYLTGKYGYRTSPNTLLDQDKPCLVDTLLSRPLRNELTRPFASAFVARRIQSLLGAH